MPKQRQLGYFFLNLVKSLKKIANEPKDEVKNQSGGDKGGTIALFIIINIVTVIREVAEAIAQRVFCSLFLP